MITLNRRHRAVYRGHIVQLHGSGATQTHQVIFDGKVVALCATLDVAERAIDWRWDNMRECDLEFGEDHDHDDEQCARVLDLMKNPF